MKKFAIGSIAMLEGRGRIFLSLAAVLWWVGGMMQPAGFAQSGIELKAQSAADVETYWTPQRLLSAKALDLRPVSGASTPRPVADRSPGIRVEGAPPKTQVAPYEARTLVPESYLETDASGVIPNLTSSVGAQFTTYRVFPDAAVTTFPNLAAGKLFFTDPRFGDNYVCSAATLRPRIVVTAGHCVAQPSRFPSHRYLFTNFLFVPAYTNGAAPVGTWTASAVRVADAWFNSDGSVPNPQDVGLLVMNDRNGKKIGSVTGFLGYWTNQLAKNHLTMLGYPVNLDNGQRMQINHAQTFQNGDINTFVYGNAMRAGSSGGPWIMNYGIAPSSKPGISGMGTNYLVAVTSYGPIASEPKYQGASNLDSRFVTLLNSACGAAPGNCQ